MLKLKFKLIFPLLLEKLNLNVYNGNEEFVQILSSILVLCLILLFSFFNIIKDFFILILIYKYKDTEGLKLLEEKYSFIKKYSIIEKIFSRYEKLSLIFILFEIIINL